MVGASIGETLAQMRREFIAAERSLDLDQLEIEPPMPSRRFLPPWSVEETVL
jgi:hypothetical protein